MKVEITRVEEKQLVSHHSLKYLKKSTNNVKVTLLKKPKIPIASPSSNTQGPKINNTINKDVRDKKRVEIVGDSLLNGIESRGLAKKQSSCADTETPWVNIKGHPRPHSANRKTETGRNNNPRWDKRLDKRSQLIEQC